MTYSSLFVVVFGGLFVLRIVAATVVFALIMPRTTRCPDCDAETQAVVSPWLDRVLPWFRRSWCLTCGWEGVLRRPEGGCGAGSRPPSAADGSRRVPASAPRR
jgi:hypothetical protein